jgi:predicted nucleic-acid-binding protein
VRGIDTNVLLRYLVEYENRNQTAQATEFIASCEAARESAYVSCIVLCELAWVLHRAFGLTKLEITNHIAQLLETDLFEVEELEVVRKAIAKSRLDPGDFADHLIGQLNLARGCRDTVTFDRALRSDPAFQVL